MGWTSMMEDGQERWDEDRYDTGQNGFARKSVHQAHSQKLSSTKGKKAVTKNALEPVGQERKDNELMEELHRLRCDKAAIQHQLLKAQSGRTKARSEASRLQSENEQLCAGKVDLQRHIAKLQNLCAQLQREKDRALMQRDEAEQALMDEWANQEEMIMPPKDRVITRSFRASRDGTSKGHREASRF
jgi:hypothetical protein